MLRTLGRAVLDHIRHRGVLLTGVAPIVRRAFELIRSGQSTRQAAAVLEAETGRLWASATVTQSTRREAYKQGRRTSG